MIAYRFLTNCIAPFIPFLIHNRTKKGFEEKSRIKERYGHSSVSRPTGNILWIHAASVGETLSVIPLVEDWLYKHKNDHILLTTATTTAAKILSKRLINRLIHQYIPFDINSWVKRFLNYWQPSALILVESELWPNLIIESYKLQIPVILINAKLSAKSFKRWQKIKPMAQHILKHIAHHYAQSEDVAKNLISLGAKNVEISANLKFASPPLPFEATELNSLKLAIKNRPCWVIASSHLGEEEEILKIHKYLKTHIPNILTILIPRHPNRRLEVQKLCIAENIETELRSESLAPTKELYLIDTLGELGLFYRLSNVVLMGGTLQPIGGHNAIEPALLGCAIILGPYIHKQKEIYELFSPHFFECKNIIEIQEKVLELLTYPSIAIKVGDSVRQIVLQQQDFIHNITNNIDKIIRSFSKLDF